jgi:hypothetical protein
VGLFSAQLPQAVRSSGYQIMPPPEDEGYIIPATVTLDDGFVPGFHGVSGGPTAVQGNTGDVDGFQAMAASYAGGYDPNFLEIPGQFVSAAQTTAGTGSANLVAPRDSGGIPGTNRLIQSAGPVSGTSDNLWSGKRAATVPKSVSVSGPVGGGQDTGIAAQRAYYSQQANYISQAGMESSLMVVN